MPPKKHDDDGRPGGPPFGTTTASSDNPFARLDESPPDTQVDIVRYLDTVAAHPEIQRVRGAAFEVLAPADGERLLDAGCGMGEVARQLAVRVGARGSVAATDLSETAVAEARKRHTGGPVSYGVADIAALPFPDDHFDGVRSERVLQHVPDPDSAIQELARVTRPGGRVCVIDTDWSSAAEDGFDHLDQVMGRLIPESNDRTAGRTIRSRMVRAGLEETTAMPVTLRFTSPTDAAVVAPFFYREVMEERLPDALFESFFASVDRAAERGDFLFALTLWICLGRVPHA